MFVEDYMTTNVYTVASDALPRALFSCGIVAMVLRRNRWASRFA